MWLGPRSMYILIVVNSLIDKRGPTLPKEQGAQTPPFEKGGKSVPLSKVLDETSTFWTKPQGEASTIKNTLPKANTLENAKLDKREGNENFVEKNIEARGFPTRPHMLLIRRNAPGVFQKRNQGFGLYAHSFRDEEEVVVVLDTDPTAQGTSRAMIVCDFSLCPLP